MSRPTNAEITLLHTRPHETQLWLSIYRPPTMLAGQVTGTMDRGSMQIPYDTVSEGNFLLVEPGMTMYIGSTVGGKDIGRIRVRGATGTYIDVAENSDIDWQADYYLTIKNFHEIWPVYPRIILSTGTTNTTWYKDWDIEYTNQNSILGTFVNMGGHAAGFLEGGSAQIYYTASGSFNLKSEPLTYEWWFQGATTTGSTANTPGYITYNTPGHYTTRLRVTASGTAQDVAYRHISIYDRPENGTSIPPLKWNLISLDGSRAQGGYTARISVREDTANIVDGALVVIFADDKYGTTDQSIGGNGLNRSNIVFAGYIVDGTVSYDHQDKSVEFEVGSPTELMKLAEGFGVSVQSSANPDTAPTLDANIPSGWVALLNMDCRRAMYHYLRWHSTVLQTTDFEFVGTDQLIQYFDSDRESLYSAVGTLMNLALVGEVVSDRQGKIWAEVSAMALNSGSSVLPFNMTVDKQDWRNVAQIDERHINDVSFLEMGGVNYQGAGFESTALMAAAPGTTPAYRGKVERIQGLALTSQSQLNTLVGNVYAYKNSRFPSVQLDIVGNYRNFDIAPQERIDIVADGSDNNRGIVWNGKAFVNQDVSWNYNSELGLFLPRLTVAEITQGFDASTIAIPPTPPTAGEDGGGFFIPPIIIPPFPPFPVPVININVPALLVPCTFAKDLNTGLEAAFDTAKYLYGFLETTPTEGICNFLVPIGTSTVTIQPVFMTLGASGNVYLEINAGYGVCGGAVTTAPLSAAAVALPVGVSLSWACLGSLIIPNVANQFVRVLVKRDVDDPSDTSTDDIWFVGVAVSFA